jgi:hypothetical protein
MKKFFGFASTPIAAVVFMAEVPTSKAAIRILDVIRQLLKRGDYYCKPVTRAGTDTPYIHTTGIAA